MGGLSTEHGLVSPSGRLDRPVPVRVQPAEGLSQSCTFVRQVPRDGSGSREVILERKRQESCKPVPVILVRGARVVNEARRNLSTAVQPSVEQNGLQSGPV